MDTKAAHNSLTMFVTDVNDVKIYNLSAGKSLPNVSSTHLIAPLVALTN